MSNEREAAKEFTKRPVKISARKWQKDGDHDHVTSLPGELWGETHAERYCKHCGMNKCNHGMIKTLEGGHIVCPGDWIIKGVKGEYYPCKPDIFDMTYTPAQQSAPAGCPADDSDDQLALLALVIAVHEEKHGGLRAAAKALGIDPAYLSRLKSGEKTSPSAEVLAAFGLERRSYYRPLLAAAPKAETVQGEK